MTIWFEKYDYTEPGLLEHLNDLARQTADGHLGIRLTEIGPDFLRGTVPVDERTRQPFGLLHGGVSVVLAESLGSVAANLCVDSATSMCVGLDINANHLRAVREGTVTGTARPFRIGRSTQVWGIELENDKQQLSCVARLTVAVLPRRH
ncbi:MAG: hotdog fold thioesterase [Gammaproteobacteria bacterium]|nr:hotdog fold thioesterase [Gammaproteobacteria bacterium]